MIIFFIDTIRRPIYHFEKLESMKINIKQIHESLTVALKTYLLSNFIVFDYENFKRSATGSERFRRS